MNMKTEELKLTQEWDKVFPKSDAVEHKKVTFVNHFGISLAALTWIFPEDAGASESLLPQYSHI